MASESTRCVFKGQDKIKKINKNKIKDNPLKHALNAI